MDDKRVFIGLDVGQRRIGVAQGDSVGRIAQPVKTIIVDGGEAVSLRQLLADVGATDIVVGRPRNQSGDETQQTQQTEAFVNSILQQFELPIYWQDESVTSVIAEDRLKQRKKPYTKADIDAEAASLILQDYLEQL